MKQEDIDSLWELNALATKPMELVSESKIKSVLRGCESNGPVYLRLSDADKDSVAFEIVEGNEEVFRKVCGHYNVTIKDDRLLT